MGSENCSTGKSSIILVFNKEHLRIFFFIVSHYKLTKFEQVTRCQLLLGILNQLHTEAHIVLCKGLFKLYEAYKSVKTFLVHLWAWYQINKFLTIKMYLKFHQKRFNQFRGIAFPRNLPFHTASYRYRLFCKHNESIIIKIKGTYVAFCMNIFALIQFLVIIRRESTHFILKIINVKARSTLMAS